MARINDFSGAAKTITVTTAQTIVFNSSEIESQGVVAYHVAFDNANNDLGALTRIRVKANGQTIYDITANQLRAYYSRFGGYELLAARQAFTIPFYSLEAPNEALADVSQFPVGAEATIELETDNSVAAGQAIIGWTKTDVDPTMYPSLIGTPMNIAASSTNARHSFATTGIVQGFGIANPSAGIGRIKCVLSGTQVLHAAGIDYVAASTQGDMFAEIQAHHREVETQLSDPLFHKLNVGLPAASGSSYFELTTGGSWGGVTEEVCLYQLHPNG